MAFTHTNEAKLAQDVESLRIQFPQTKDLYREVCRLMFFRYGMQPTANKLYQLVRKGTMSTPSQAVNSFWAELRSKNRVDIEHAGLPDSLREFAGEALGALWKSALEAARQTYKEKHTAINGLESSNRLELESYKAQVKKLEALNTEQHQELAAIKKQLQENEKRLLIDSQLSVTQKESVKTLQNEKTALEATLKSVNNEFIAEINKLHAALKLSDDRFRKLEAKSFAELDRERQRAIKLELEIAELKKSLLKEHTVTKTQTMKNQKLVNELRENIGLIKGQLKESQRQQLVASNKLKQIERKKPLLK
ncbi:replication region DNA-binding N-term [Methylophilus rhizosphaerae]|uniref:Replication region DNA-binding N-term n=1 Tax=Methylophilus rhizosphaerae TaxID=492660 RepID=A0A1G9F9Y2_9PROT|nr:DNA-binding protein [Methylophilus rhizosphaerae]SDK85161.1 replication region DNA-binding N-term [Methylophilus rhizosphaerae]